MNTHLTDDDTDGALFKVVRRSVFFYVNEPLNYNKDLLRLWRITEWTYSAVCGQWHRFNNVVNKKQYWYLRTEGVYIHRNKEL